MAFQIPQDFMIFWHEQRNRQCEQLPPLQKHVSRRIGFTLIDVGDGGRRY